MATNLVFDLERVRDFVRARTAINKVDGSQAIGLERNGVLLAGVLYEGYNGVNVWMHVAALEGARWATRDFLTSVFRYPFVQLGCKRVSAYVEAWNGRPQALNEHVGFTREATLKGAASDGGDAIIYAMTKGECRYVDTK